MSKFFFPLKGQVSIIKYAEENPKYGSRQLAEKFNRGRTNIQTILKNKESVLSYWKINENTHLRKKRRPAGFKNANKAI